MTVAFPKLMDTLEEYRPCYHLHKYIDQQPLLHQPFSSLLLEVVSYRSNLQEIPVETVLRLSIDNYPQPLIGGIARPDGGSIRRPRRVY